MEEIEDIIASAAEDAEDFPDDKESGQDTWVLEDGSAIKRTDRHIFLFRETVLPEKIQDFFSINDLQQGKKRNIVLWQDNHRYDAFIERTLHDPPVTRLRWDQQFGLLVRKKYPEWYDFFKKSREDSGDTPAIYFTRRQERDHYTLAFEGDLPDGTATDFEIPVEPGNVIDNETLRTTFKCSSQGAMRRSLSTNSLVLIADHTKPACDDRWIGRTFHFTGMGLTGGQGFSFNQNKALFEADKKGTGLFLFEVFTEGNYTYIGKVELADDPYLSRQTDNEKTPRDVTVFPLKLRGKNHPSIPKKDLPETKEETVRKKTQKLPLDELEFHARYSQKEGSRREVVSEVFEGDQIVSEYAKRKADGICQLCNMPAPFKNKNGAPFLEIHHIIPLAEGGVDTIDNVAALCPNCHRKMHELNLPGDVVRLRNRASLRE